MGKERRESCVNLKKINIFGFTLLHFFQHLFFLSLSFFFSIGMARRRKERKKASSFIGFLIRKKKTVEEILDVEGKKRRELKKKKNSHSFTPRRRCGGVILGLHRLTFFWEKTYITY